MFLQTQLPADLLDFRLDLLYVAGTVVALANDDMQMRLPALFRVSDALFQDLLCFLYILPVQVYRVAADFTGRVVLAEDVLGSLFVVVVGGRGVLFRLLARGVGPGTVATFVCLAGLGGEVLVLALFLAC